ncbi:OmpA family protein [Maridesulfovibrio ferrireducens]|uniref:OmpA family protein n=1 Tax=Maridesulfovibrio ferrireducens TaxID=246191 RepID=UPI001A297B69|nr:OmpA family protein [Maridesulfovibrio ferrireducens]MBI9111276.1 OmpA family protein [Maridesulfovibrio ferrireducens]
MKTALSSFCCLLILLTGSALHAQEDGFANDSDQILEMLLGPADSAGDIYGLTANSGMIGRANLKIEFDVNSAKIKKEALPIANALGAAMISPRGSSMSVLLKGHTDSDGDKKYNRKLSLKRAEAVRLYLVEKFKINPARISVKGIGEDEPLISNDTKEGKAFNRRVEVVNTTGTKGVKEPKPKQGTKVEW